MHPEDRLIAIESKIAQQEDLVESLNQTVYNQQKKIDQLEDLFSALVRRIKDSAAGPADNSQDNERPPHY
jgi:SlyX protein